MGRLRDALPPGGELSSSMVSLRPLAVEDAPSLVAGARDEDVIRWTNITLDYSADDAARFVAARKAEWERDTRASFAIVTGEAGTVGHISIRTAWVRGIGEVGYWLLPEWRGRGFAAEAVRIVRDWAIDALGLTRVQACVQPGNQASMAVLEHVGFRREGLLRNWDTLKGDLHDEWMFAFVPGDPRE